jgi:hypothetical protein
MFSIANSNCRKIRERRHANRHYTPIPRITHNPVIVDGTVRWFRPSQVLLQAEFMRDRVSHRNDDW